MAGTELDTLTGTATTGHEWDGIKELNTPLPKWWLYVFYATHSVWALAYCVVYPSWPLAVGGYTQGMLGYSSRQEFERADGGPGSQPRRPGTIAKPQASLIDADQRRSATC